MSNLQRAVLLGAAALVVVAAIVLVGGGDDEKSASKGKAPAAGARKPPAIQIRKGAPVGGVKSVTVKKGERIRLVVTTTDTTDEIHMHGYDKKKELSPGHSVRFDLPATIEGVFEVELENAGVQIAELKVEP